MSGLRLGHEGLRLSLDSGIGFRDQGQVLPAHGPEAL